MDHDSAYVELISGKRRGLAASLGRGGLRLLSTVYGRLVAARNFYYDCALGTVPLDVPVISVGNLTVGGTGKTPMALWLCRELLRRGLKPAVLSRGYKASEEGLADELMLFSRRCPEAVAIANPDRVAAGRLAVSEYNARAVILDDGFQHRRLARDLDIVLIDATRPFGFGYVLPRGLLRESVAGLRRAGVVVVTRCDQCQPEKRASIDDRVRTLNPEVPIVHAVHRPAGFTDLAGKEMAAPSGSRIGCFAAIARPEAFARTLADLNIAPVESRWWPDHHAYGAGDVEAIRGWVNEAELDGLVTTEKDAVKLASLDVDWPVPVAVLAIEIEMLDDGGRVLCDLIDGVFREYEDEHETDAETD